MHKRVLARALLGFHKKVNIKKLKGRSLALTTFCRENCKLKARQNTQRLRGCWVTKPPQMPPASPLSFHATVVTVEVEVIVMVLVMVMVAVTVSPVAVVVAVTVAVAAVVVSSVLPQPCKDREAMKPKQMAANARTSCMITRVVMRVSKADAVQASSLLNPNRSMNKIS